MNKSLPLKENKGALSLREWFRLMLEDQNTYTMHPYIFDGVLALPPKFSQWNSPRESDEMCEETNTWSWILTAGGQAKRNR